MKPDNIFLGKIVKCLIFYPEKTEALSHLSYTHILLQLEISLHFRIQTKKMKSIHK